MENPAQAKILQYHLNEKIGSGFAGDIYHAWDSGLDRNVAIRIIRSELVSDTAFKAQIMNTALAARELSHPNVCRFYGVEETDDRLLIVTEFTPGRSLKSIIKERALEPKQFLKMALQIAQGLNAIHELAIAHRYVTTNNVILTTDGVFKLTDTGISPTPKMLSKASDYNIFEKMVYFAPEFLAGNSSTQASDQYSLGVVLFESITGNLPYLKNSREQLIKMIENPVWREKSFEDIHHSDIYLLITKMMALDPEDRFANAEELIASIREVDLTHTENLSPSPSTPQSKLKARFYLMTSMAFFLLVLFWLIVKGFGGL